MMRFVLAGLVALAATPVYAADPADASNSAVVVRAFTDVCAKNLNYLPYAVTEWAENNKAAATGPDVLDALVGKGAKAGAWTLPSSPPGAPILVSIGQKAPSCSVWSQHADIAAVMRDFTAFVESYGRNGFEVKRLPDKKSLAGESLVQYDVLTPDYKASYHFVLVTADDAKAPYQVHMMTVSQIPN